MNKMIIAGHGYFAQGICSSLSIISGNTDNIICINGFTDECNNPEEAIHKLIVENEEVLVMTDLSFGSINQYFIRELQNKDFTLVTGTNLPLAMEVHQRLLNGIDLSDLEEICLMAGSEVKHVTKVVSSVHDDSDETL